MSRHPAVLIFASAILGVIAACNAISGVGSITFDRTPDAGAPGAGGGGGRGAPDAAGGGGAPDAGACVPQCSTDVRMCCSGGACQDIDTSADAANCGVCGYACSFSQSCQCGHCEGLVQLATAQDEPWNITVDLDEHVVYWTNSALQTMVDGAIMSLSLDGGSATPTQITAFDGGQYQVGIGWNDAGGIYSASAGAVTSDAYAWYFTSKTNETVTRLPFHDAGTGLAANQDTPAGIAVVNGNVYWANYDGGVLMTVPVDGSGMPSPLTDADAGLSPWNLAVDTSNLYWTAQNQHDLTTSAVMKMSLVGNTITTVAMPQYKPWGIVVDECYVYWTNDNATAGTVMRVSKTGGPVTTLVVQQQHPRGIAMDGQNVYWVTSGSETVSHTGAVWELAK
jgi:hypothetical protein